MATTETNARRVREALMHAARVQEARQLAAEARRRIHQAKQLQSVAQKEQAAARAALTVALRLEAELRLTPLDAATMRLVGKLGMLGTLK